MKSSDFIDYMSTIRSAAARHCFDGEFYGGEEGAKRFAREVGAALPCFSKNEKDLHDMVSATYSGVCVIAYHLRPPVNANVWIREMWVGIRDALGVVQVPMPEGYEPMPFIGLDSSPDSYKALWRGEAMKEDRINE